MRTKIIGISVMSLALAMAMFGAFSIPSFATATCCTVYVVHSDWNGCGVKDDGWGLMTGTQLNFWEAYPTGKTCSVITNQTTGYQTVMDYAGTTLTNCNSCMIEFHITTGALGGVTGGCINTAKTCPNNLEVIVYGTFAGVPEIVLSWYPSSTGTVCCWKNEVSPLFNLPNGLYNIDIINPSAYPIKFTLDEFKMGS